MSKPVLDWRWLFPVSGFWKWATTISAVIIGITVIVVIAFSMVKIYQDSLFGGIALSVFLFFVLIFSIGMAREL